MSKKRLLHDLITQVATAGLALQDRVGRMPAGSNGPWEHTETPVRVTAHWAITFLSAYRTSGEQRFGQAAARALRYLHSEEARPHGVTFYCRCKGGKDRANNVIGQAWAMEALLEDGAEDLAPGSTVLATDVGRLLPYDATANLWRRVEIDGSTSAISWTLNQQVMLAAVLLKAGRLRGAGDLYSKGVRFFTGLPEQVLHAQKDVPHHHLLPLHGHKLSRTLAGLGWPLNRRRWMSRSLGYLSFVLYGLGCARLWAPEVRQLREGPLPRMAHQWIRLITEALPFGCGEDPRSFRWAYNPTGFEVAVAIHAFEARGSAAAEFAEELVNMQVGYLDPRTSLPRKHLTFDPATLVARTYEATRLADDFQIAGRHPEACADGF